MTESDQNISVSPLQIIEGEDFVPAPLVTRILAYILDLAACGVIALALHRFAGTWILNTMGNNSYIGMTLNTSLWFICILGYWAVIPAVSGATPAKMLFRLRIISESPGPVSLPQVLQREILGHAATILSAGLGFVYLSTRDEKGRALNDRISGTRLIQFSPPRPELYRVQDLHADTKEGVWLSYEAVEDAGTAADSEPGSPVSRTAQETASTVDPEIADNSIAGTENLTASMKAPAGERGVTAPEAEGFVTNPAGLEVSSVPPPKTGSLYARPSAETAYERKQRAAMGPTVLDLAEALRRTAELVQQGQLMEKVLERKRQEFVARMEHLDMTESPAESIKVVIELGRDGLLNRDELQTVRDILQKRLAE